MWLFYNFSIKYLVIINISFINFTLSQYLRFGFPIIYCKDIYNDMLFNSFADFLFFYSLFFCFFINEKYINIKKIIFFFIIVFYKISFYIFLINGNIKFYLLIFILWWLINFLWMILWYFKNYKNKFLFSLTYKIEIIILPVYNFVQYIRAIINHFLWVFFLIL